MKYKLCISKCNNDCTRRPFKSALLTNMRRGMAMTFEGFDILILPGLGNSGPEHWQTHWQEALPTARRVEQDNWDMPDRQSWLATLAGAVENARRPPLLVAHSLSCALVAHYAAENPEAWVAGAFLVSPSDVDSPAHTPEEVRDFAPLPMAPLPFPAALLASRDDPYVDLARAEEVAKVWGASFHDMGALGHMNGASALGRWPAAMAIFERFAASLSATGKAAR